MQNTNRLNVVSDVTTTILEVIIANTIPALPIIGVLSFVFFGYLGRNWEGKRLLMIAAFLYSLMASSSVRRDVEICLGFDFN